MRIAAVLHEDSWRIGVVTPETGTVGILPASAGTVDDVVRSGNLPQPGPFDVVLDIEKARFGAPIQRFTKNIFCVGWNYWEHFEESAGKREGQEPAGRPEHPTFFTKAPNTAIGPQDGISVDSDLSRKWDYEAEVAIVIGKGGRSIPEAHAAQHIYGYMLANDVSARDIQRAHGGQWFKGKSIDKTMPMGPWITTADQIVAPRDILLECVLNGKVLQSASTSLMAFSFARIISELSLGLTLEPGDVILTGTPAGIGNARDPQVFLQPGDELITRAAGLGQLRNTVASIALV
ncbi:fumarylacetoacetate hydrolase family protein [Paenarthrobacter sp. NPDC056912]|uniref:fumarylacetoacetate hydrolase family protein n=1 Tax=Paenarthrobacter sp. NPDC056912 TaxID=3345965 RepID=UPI00366C16BF